MLLDRPEPQQTCKVCPLKKRKGLLIAHHVSALGLEGWWHSIQLKKRESTNGPTLASAACVSRMNATSDALMGEGSMSSGRAFLSDAAAGEGH